MNDVKKNGKDKDQAGELGTRVERQKAKSSLPKRSQVHQNKKKKSKVKIKFPMIKLLSLFFILLPVGFYSLNTYLQEKPERTRSDQVVNYNENEDADKETIPTTATADDLKDNDLEKEEKNSAKSEAEKKKEKEKQKAEEKEQAKKKAEEKEKAQQEAEEKAKAKQIAEEKAKAKQIAEEKAKKEAAEDKKTTERAPAVKPNKDEYKVVLHTVKAEETLFRISMNYYNSQEGIALIKEWNGLNGNEISKGQVLKIPIKK
ncbi:LysM peptidoglycan-binding domain-containing protein [Peribacillus butanolivorans]|uniref:LysM peptidoglycan-binding domain-containing protein n=1 Tax=Peribacillus butanolivorans TaxID=421767 RepID=UPI0013C2FF8D|nr:LysM peptidoglycan-binding domain-containing protein [Peribacillus butanolivorans]